MERATAQLMADQSANHPRSQVMVLPRRKVPHRKNRPQDPNAPLASQFPAPEASQNGDSPVAHAPQPIGTTFTGATLADTGSFPPDTMGAAGPSQFFVFVNGRLRTFVKATGVADGVVNADPDVFFSSVMSPPPTGGLNFTSSPQIRYDRLSGRWILTAIDVPSSSPSNLGDNPNRILIAVSDTDVITGGTVWTFYFVQQNTVGGGDTGGFFADPSLGVDNNALYVGGNEYNAATGAWVNTDAYVIRKSSVLSGGPVVTTPFRGLITTDGPDTPRGVDNYNPTANEGYFIGVSDAAAGRLIMRRISTPGGTPGISADIAITVNATSFPIAVDHLGNTGGVGGNLDALDDRLFAAHIRNGRLWTAHNIAVLATGVASDTGATRRDAVRWYELIVPVGTGTPTVNQSGTIFDSAATTAAARQYLIPTVTVSGQGHAAFGFSTAGTPFHIDAAANGRLAGDTLGTLGAPTLYSASGTAYNPAGDPGGPLGRRWGDYSFTSLDPGDDMTMWTIQEFCDSANSYGVQVAKLIAPPPAAPASANPPSIASGQASVSVTITGTVASGSGFFDPGTGFANRIGASVTGGVVVNSITYTDPTHVTLDLNTIAASAGAKNVTVTNPDGQFATGTGILTVTGGAPALTLSSAVSRKTHGGAGTFDINLPLSSPFGVECRSGAAGHSFVFTFSNPVTSGSASVTGGTGNVSGSPTFVGNTMTVNLTGVTDVQQITVTLTGVTDTFAQVLPDTPVSAKILLGDTNGNSSVNAGDVAQTKGQSGNAVGAGNFRNDTNANGSINAGDVGQVKANSGHSLP